MTTKGIKHESRGDSPSDLAALWQVALSEYTVSSGLDLAIVPKYHTFADIKADRSVQKGFEEYRRGKGNIVKLGHLLSTNADLVIKSAQYVANAASVAFPPSSAILTALTLVMTAAHDVSKDYDTIMTFFEEFNSFLERVEMLENNLPQFDGYRSHLLQVFAAMLKLCGVARKAVKEGKLKRFGKTILRGGSDSNLTDAIGSLETAMKRLESATGIATLAIGVTTMAGVQELKEGNNRLEFQTVETHHLVNDMNATQLRSEAEMREHFQAMADRFDKIYESQSRSAASAVSSGELQSMDPGLRKQAAFNTVNSVFPNKDSPVSHLQEIQHVTIENTATWLQERQEYLSWKEGRGNGNVLWLSGPAGSGKSCIAYSVHEDVKLSTASDPEISVACIYLKDFAEDERPEKGMLCSIINQIAARDTEYCEQIAAAFTRAGNLPDWTDEDIVKDLWQLFVATHFDSDSKSRLFLILDGADESESAGDTMTNFLKQIVEDKLRMTICITSRPLWKFPREELGESFTEIQLQKQDVKGDMGKLITARISSHPRLYRCRKQTKRWILSQVLEKADTLLSAEHMLLELGNIHQESILTKQLMELPGTLHDLFERLETAILTNRRPHQIKALQTLFAWLAFASRPLTVADANALLRMHLDDRFFDVEEELSGTIGQILEITSTIEDEDLNSEFDDAHQDLEGNAHGDKIDTWQVTDNQKPSSNSADSILRFRSRSLRDFFTSTSDKQDRLRTSPARSHAAIFGMPANLLCGVGIETLDEHQREIGEALMDYAASSWSYHFAKIDISGLSDDQIVDVLHSIKNIMTNQNNVVEVIEKHSGEHPTMASSMLWGADRYMAVIDNLNPWLAKGITLGKDRLGDDFAWIQKSSDDEDHIMVDSLHGYTKNWLKYVYEANFVRAYGLSLAAFAMTDDLEIASIESFRQDADCLSANTVKAIALFSSDSQHWKTHLSIGIALARFSQAEEAFASLEIALTLVHTETERAEVLYAIADAGQMYLVNKTLFSMGESVVPEKQELHMQPDDLASATKEVGSSGDDSTHANGQLSGNLNTRGYDHYREIAENVLSTFSTTQGDQQEWIRKCTLIIARCHLEVGRTEEAVENYEKAQRALPDVPLDAQLYYMMASAYEKLGPQDLVDRIQRWNFFEIMTWVCTRLLDAATMSHPWHHILPLHQAAKALGKQHFVVDLYERIISYQEARGGGMEIRFRLGCLYLTEYYDMETALSKAKEQFYRVLNSKTQKNLVMGTNDTWLLPGARDAIVEIIYQQFRNNRDLSEKQSLLTEIRRLQEENINEALRNTDPEESSSAIIYARMLHKMGSSVEYAEVLDRVFQSCVTALKDVDGANDQASLVLLAKVLACLPGLGDVAQMAFSAQYSIIDQKIALTQPDGKFGLQKPPPSWYAGARYGDVDITPLTPEDEPVAPDNESTAAEEKDESAPTETEERYKYVSHPQWGDIMPCRSNFCDGNRRHKIVHWENIPNYLCITCVDTQLCAECYDNIQLVNAGEKTWEDIGGSRFCGLDHRYIKGPMQGWLGIRDGYFIIEAEDGMWKRKSFDLWLTEIEDAWKEAWDSFWASEELESVLG